MSETFAITRVGGEHGFRVDVTEDGEITSIYEVQQSALPWIVKKLLRGGAVFITTPQGSIGEKEYD